MAMHRLMGQQLPALQQLLLPGQQTMKQRSPALNMRPVQLQRYR